MKFKNPIFKNEWKESKKGEMRSIIPDVLGWIEYKLDDQEMDYVWRCINAKSTKRFNERLAGHVTGSYELKDRSDWFLLNTLRKLLDKYSQNFKNLGDETANNQKHPYKIANWWVNYQKQGEFNPFHNHYGVYSFVIWMKIPVDWHEQNQIPFARESNSKTVSCFEFVYKDILGKDVTYDYRLSSKDEGVMLLFPSKMSHVVYPFYNCDEDRVSVSGNIEINTAKSFR